MEITMSDLKILNEDSKWEDDEDEEEYVEPQPESTVSHSDLEQILARIKKGELDPSDPKVLSLLGLDLDDESEDVEPTQPTVKPVSPLTDEDLKKANVSVLTNLSSLLSKYGEKIDNSSSIDWSKWSDEDITEYNELVRSTKEEPERYHSIGQDFSIDPYALWKIDIDLWPEHLRQKAIEILHNDDQEWADIKKGTVEYGVLKELFTETIKYYKDSGNVDPEKSEEDYIRDMNNYLRFLEQYFENSSAEIPPPYSKVMYLAKKHGVEPMIQVARTKANGDQENPLYRYFLVPYQVLKSLAKNNDIYAEKLSEIERVPVPASIIERPKSFGTVGGKTPVREEPGNTLHFVAGLSNAISKLFSTIEYKDESEIDYEVIAKLDKVIGLLQEYSEDNEYMPGWEDSKLLTIYRLFSNILPKDTNKYPNWIQFEQDFNRAATYINKIVAPNTAMDIMNKVQQTTKPYSLVDHLYVYKEIDGDKMAAGYNERPPAGYENVGKLGDKIKINQVDKLADYRKITQEAKELASVSEGIVTTPTTIVVNGSPFKLRFGDRVIIDSVKEV